jgi:hypothetical protein
VKLPPLPFAPLLIKSEASAQAFIESEPPQKWNVLSLWAEGIGPGFPNARTIRRLQFHDIVHGEEGRLCTAQDIADAVTYGRVVRNEPLLVHCHAGISRSTAMAFLLVLDAYRDRQCPADDAIRLIHHIRPIAYPNRHIIHLGLDLLSYGDEELLTRWTRELYNSATWQRITGNGVPLFHARYTTEN